jgi:uncharacterized protein (UPF0303 family)
MDLTSLDEEAHRLVFAQFSEETALDLGLTLVGLATERALPVVIDIRTPDRTLFHAAMPGSTPLNDLWARRKSATALATQRASMAVGLKNRERGTTVARDGLDPMTHADHGGAVPIRVAGVGVVAVATVSGLPQEDDHRLVVEAIDTAVAAAAEAAFNLPGDQA